MKHVEVITRLSKILKILGIKIYYEKPERRTDLLGNIYNPNETGIRETMHTRNRFKRNR